MGETFCDPDILPVIMRVMTIIKGVQVHTKELVSWPQGPVSKLMLHEGVIQSKKTAESLGSALLSLSY